ncbi:MAG TPA: nucleoside deaminase [Candidatus Limnocylindria bacterium]|nr:nucleoside deaminase [Candidatus Limnocylindria bacterium]
MSVSPMDEAIREAREGIRAGHGGPFGAVVVRGGAIIGRGHNRVIQHNDPTCHGEIEAIRDACRSAGTFDLSGADIYTTSEPCPMCLGAVLWANIRRVYYGCDRQDAEAIGFRDRVFYEAMETGSYRLIPQGRDECLEVFREYMDLPDKARY